MWHPVVVLHTLLMFLRNFYVGKTGCYNSTHHYLTFLIRPLFSNRGKIIKHIVARAHKAIIKHCPKHKEFIGPSWLYFLPTLDSASHNPLKVPKQMIMDITSLIGTRIIVPYVTPTLNYFNYLIIWIIWGV